MNFYRIAHFIDCKLIYFIVLEEVIIEVIPSAAGAVEVTGNNQRPLDLQMPISIHLDHLHNIYVAAGTLACALLIVVFTVSISFFSKSDY